MKAYRSIRIIRVPLRQILPAVEKRSIDAGYWEDCAVWIWLQA